MHGIIHVLLSVNPQISRCCYVSVITVSLWFCYVIYLFTSDIVFMNRSPYHKKVKYNTVKGLEQYSCSRYLNKKLNNNNTENTTHTNICIHSKCKVDPAGICPVLEQQVITHRVQILRSASIRKP